MALTKLQRLERDKTEADLLDAQGRHGESRTLRIKLVEEYLSYLRDTRRRKKKEPKSL